LGRPRQQEWDINQGISDEEICKAISSTPNFKACGPDMVFQWNSSKFRFLVKMIQKDQVIIIVIFHLALNVSKP